MRDEMERVGSAGEEHGGGPRMRFMNASRRQMERPLACSVVYGGETICDGGEKGQAGRRVAQRPAFASHLFICHMRRCRRCSR